MTTQSLMSIEHETSLPHVLAEALERVKDEPLLLQYLLDGLVEILSSETRL